MPEDLDKIRDEKGQLPKFAWPGGYPILYYAESGDTYCGDCANQDDAEPPITAYDVFYEGPTIVCSGCAAEIQSAYGDPDLGSEIEGG